MTDNTQRLAEAILSSDNEDAHSSYDARDARIRRRMALSRAITLIESRADAHMEQADLLLNYLLRHSPPDGMNEGSSPLSFRVGIAGPPGAGKSSFIETFGLFILNKKLKTITATANETNESENDGTKKNDDFQPSKLAVICIDPSSTLTGGSILGDKTRMTELSRSDRAFVRPSPSKGTLGGLAAYTNDAICLCQAAGYDFVLVETVGLGQSEVEICEGVDMLVLLVPPAGGDELQGVKKGIVEMASMLVVNKADGNLLPAARTTAADYEAAIRFFRRRDVGWEVPSVLLVSAKTGEGMERVWEEISRFRRIMTDNRQLYKKRQQQSLYWMHKNLRDLIIARARSDPFLRENAERLEADLMNGLITPRAAATELVDSLTQSNLNG